MVVGYLRVLSGDASVSEIPRQNTVPIRHDRLLTVPSSRRDHGDPNVRFWLLADSLWVAVLGPLLGVKPTSLTQMPEVRR
jgi:hypothetical protein